MLIETAIETGSCSFARGRLGGRLKAVVDEGDIVQHLCCCHACDDVGKHAVW